MARRRKAGGGGPVASVIAAVALRLAGAIVLATLALVVWNIGTRSPLDLVRDIRLSLKRPRAIFTGLVCFAVGMIFVAAATILLIPTLPRAEVELVPAEILMFLVALVLEHLIGPQLRNLVTGSATSRS